MSNLAAGAAPGKVILFGEHAVVYGRPAVAAALEHGLGASAEPDDDGPTLRIPGWGKNGMVVRLAAPNKAFDAIARAYAAALDAAELGRPPVCLTLDGELPLGVGLGSSAAFAVAILRALADFRGRPFSPAELLEAAALVETVFHGTPSGLDHTVVADGGCLRFQKDAEPAFTPVKLPAPVPLVVAWTLRQGSTRDVVGGLRARRDAHPAPYDRLFDLMAHTAEAGIAALEAGDHAALGALFDINHGLLNACGVSNLENERMVRVARDAGALGAKLTGAGMGGAVIAVVPERPARVVGALRDAGFSAFATRVG